MPVAVSQMADVAADAIRRYDDLKLEIAAIAQAAMLQSEKDKDAEGAYAFQTLLARLAEDRFNLAVVGPCSRGKSSLMNAILGFEGLPTGILPHTSVITTVTYGPLERVLVRCDGWSLPQEIRLEQLAEYVTEEGNPGNQRRVAVAEIELPAEILRHGLHLIDTPGLGSAIIANTETTERFRPEIDAAIFVSSFDFALSEADIQFLRKVRETVGIVFFVLNKLDLVSEIERVEVARFVRERLDREPSIEHCALFSVSAKRGLEAKRLGDGTALSQSGLPGLEAALAAFLSGDKTRQLTVRVMDRLVTLLRRKLMHAGFVRNRSDEEISQALDKLIGIRLSLSHGARNL
jgi:GTP-binding protein EngB required for normal cell division